MFAELLAIPAATLWVTAAAALLGGMVRGAAGFGGALVMVPVFALVSLPAAAVATVLLIECIGYVDMMRHVGRRVDWRAIVPLMVAALLTVPIGVYAVTQLSAPLMIRVIAGCVIGSALVLLVGWRYAGQPRLPMVLGVGATSGILEGMAGIPGPPVALFLYGGPQSAQTVRDNLVGYFLVLDLATLLAFAAQGSVKVMVLWLAALSLPLSLVGNAIGVRLAASLPDAMLRKGALVVILLAGMALLLR